MARMQPLPPTVLTLWRWIGLGLGVVVAAIGVAAWLGLRRIVDDVPTLFVAAAVAGGALVAAAGWTAAAIRYRAWRFELTESWIRAKWGVVAHRTATVPRNRVQTLTSENGPIDRLLGLTSVTIHTAGAGAPNLTIPHLDDRTVDWLRSELAAGRLDGRGAAGASATGAGAVADG